MSKFNYWEECLAIAFEEAGIKATQEQIKEVACCVEGAHDNYSTAMGYDAIPNPAQEELDRLKSSIKKKQEWINKTEPCIECFTTGWVTDGWGRGQVCYACRGKGRV